MYRYLCRKKRYRKRDRVYETRGKLNKGTSIDERPSIVDVRQRIGDWKVDTVIGIKTGPSLVSMVDRVSRLSQFIKVETRKSNMVASVIIEQFKSLGKPVYSITADNGNFFC